MVLGAGAVGMVIEAEPAALARGVTPKSTLVATQVANSAFHPCSLDRHHISRQLQLLMKRVQV
jgi:3-oxoacyl-(acyl-carrier-protein) synthase